MEIELEKEVLDKIDTLVDAFIKKEDMLSITLDNLLRVLQSKKLKPFIHTVKGRLKEPDHLRHKLIRKAKKAKKEGIEFDITEENLSIKLNDLVGVRIIHLHTKQFEKINLILKDLLKEENYEIVEGPIAKTWDDESRRYFRSIQGVQTEDNENMYTSVHYDVRANSRTTCEIQVRTLMEEVWGEVDHSINYPEQTGCFSCREQIKALARSTSSSSRLVDSIFSTYEEFLSAQPVKPTAKKLSENKRKGVPAKVTSKKNLVPAKVARKKK
jgi:putative GTP pyrophosphokinase